MKYKNFCFLSALILLPVSAFADLVAWEPRHHVMQENLNMALLLVVPMVLTVFIEAVVLRFMLKQKGQFVNISLLNVFTNPLANIAFYEICEAVADWTSFPRAFAFLSLFIIELVVIVVEAKLLRRIGVERPARASIILNLSSLIIGTGLLIVSGFVISVLAHHG